MIGSVLHNDADDLGVMESKVKDAVQLNWGFLGTLQGSALL